MVLGDSVFSIGSIDVKPLGLQQVWAWETEPLNKYNFPIASKQAMKSYLLTTGTNRINLTFACTYLCGSKDSCLCVEWPTGAALVPGFFTPLSFFHMGYFMNSVSPFWKVTAWYLVKDLCELGERIKGWLCYNALYNCFQEYVDDGKITEGQQVIFFFSYLYICRW